MTEISRVALFGKLNSIGYKAIEGATVFCKMRGNPYVEIVHWLAQIVQLPDSDFHRIMEHFKIDQSKLASDMTRALDALPRGASSIGRIFPIISKMPWSGPGSTARCSIPPIRCARGILCWG